VIGRLPDEPRILVDVPLEVDPAEVLRFQGYKRHDVPGADVRALFDEALAQGTSLMQPRAVLRWVRVSRQEPDSITAGGEVLGIPGITARWGLVDFVAAAVCTIGGEIEQRVRELWEARELPLALMLDSVGSGAAESLAEYVNDVLCQDALDPGFKVTNRVSPGYGSWDVREQQRLFRLCSGASIGVSLNEACFMLPEKSITLLAGAGPAARVDDYFSQCARCWMAGCAYRRAPAQRTVRRGPA
jgi:hypothetical protein